MLVGRITEVFTPSAIGLARVTYKKALSEKVEIDSQTGVGQDDGCAMISQVPITLIGRK